MNYRNEREIDLVDLLFYVLEKWKLYILVGVIGLLVLSAYKYYKVEQGRMANDALIAEGREDEVINASDYQSALDALNEQERKIRGFEEDITEKKVDITTFNTNIANNRDNINITEESIERLETEQAEIQRKLEELQAYMDGSVVMKIDATARPAAEKTYQVVYSGEGAEALFRDPVDEILAGYVQNITLIGAGTGLEQKYGIAEKYLDELFKVSYDIVPNSIYVIAKGTDRQMAEDICAAVCKMIENRKQDLSNRYHAHSLKSVSENYSEIVDEGLANTQSSRYNSVNAYKSQLADYDAKILNAKTTIDNLNQENDTLIQQITTANDSISDLQQDILKVRKSIIENKLEEKVAAKAPSKARSLKDGIKFGIIGAIVCAILVAVLDCVMYVMGGRLHTAAEIAVFELPVLAVLNRPERKRSCFIDKWIYRMRNKGWATGNEEIMKTGAVSLGKLIGEEKKIAILSSLNQDALKKVTESLKSLISGVEFVPVAESFRSAENASVLNGVDGVVLYEKREASRISDIEAELGQAKLLEKRIIGSIVE